MEMQHIDKFLLEEHEVRQLRYAFIKALKAGDPLAIKIVPKLECIGKENVIKGIITMSLEKFLNDFVGYILKNYDAFSKYGLPAVKVSALKIEAIMKPITRLGYTG